MDFQKYQHIERFDTTEVDGITKGTCYVFPKIDGTNGSVWLGNDRKLHTGSRKRELSSDSDNRNFFKIITADPRFIEFLMDYPNYKIFGEWLVPHTIKNYNSEAWNKFYVFDIIEHNERTGNISYLKYDYYSKLLNKYDINYIPLLGTVKDGTKEDFTPYLDKNHYLLDDNSFGEGIVIKNYDFINKFGRTTWAKIIRNEFIQKHNPPKKKDKKQKGAVEEKIVRKYITPEFVEKEYQKFISQPDIDGWSSKLIPRFLETIYHTFIKEECYNFVKKYKNPTIDFKKLKSYVSAEIKNNKPELFY